MMTQRQSGIFLFNIIPRYRPGMSDVFDYARETYSAAILPSEGQRFKQNTLFLGFENICGECLEDLDLLYIFATDGYEFTMGEYVSDYAMINWKSPGTFTPTMVNDVEFVPDVGFQPDGTSSYFNTGYIASTHATSYTQDDASIFCYINNDIADNNDVDFGIVSSGSSSHILMNSRQAANLYSIRINSGTAEGRTSTSSQGFHHLQRTSSTVSRIIKDGSQVGSNLVGVSSGVPTRVLPIFANNNTGTIGSFSARGMGMFGLGASLSGQESALYTVWNTYFTSL